MSVIKTTLPLADPDQKWDAGEAIKNVKAWASGDDGIDFTKYRKAFFFVDDDNDGDDDGGKAQGDYKLPFADVIDGKLEAVWNGVAAAMGALNGAQGGVKLGDEDDEKEALYKQIGVYYKKFDKEQPALKKSIVREVGERVDAIMNIDQASVKDLGDGVFEATITNSEVDRMGESIDYKGIDTANYMNNPVVLYGHDYTSLPIGKTLKLTKSNTTSSWKARFQLATEILPFAATVAALVKGGFLNAVSIGGVVRQWNENYTEIQKMEMVEFSIVPVPANPAALITSRSLEEITGKSVEQVASEYREAVQQTTAEKLEKSLDIDELDRHIKTLKDLTVILETAKTAKTNEKDTPEADEKITLTLRKTAGKVSETGQQIIRLVKAKKED